MNYKNKVRKNYEFDKLVENVYRAMDKYGHELSRNNLRIEEFAHSTFDTPAHTLNHDINKARLKRFRQSLSEEMLALERFIANEL